MEVGSLLETTLAAVAVSAATTAVEDRSGANADRNAAITYGVAGAVGLAAWAWSDSKSRGRPTLVSNLGKGAYYAAAVLGTAQATRAVDQAIANGNSGTQLLQVDQAQPQPQPTMTQGGINQTAAQRRLGWGYAA